MSDEKCVLSNSVAALLVIRIEVYSESGKRAQIKTTVGT